jgi:hypothetical protein
MRHYTGKSDLVWLTLRPCCLSLFIDGSGSVMFFDGLTGQPINEPGLAAQTFVQAKAAYTLPATADGVAVLGVVDGDNT